MNNHTFQPATCKRPAKCSDCGKEVGSPDTSKHWLSEASCKEPAKCEICGIYVGEPDRWNFYRYL